ncbi:MAG: hypothetical protein ACOX0F_08295 [Syntrophomonadaceae bacterium]|jgi:hypothetical protein
MLNRVAWLLVFIFLICTLLVYQWGSCGQYIVAGSLLTASIAMGVYLAAKWSILTSAERWGIIFSIPVWLLLALSLR